MARSVLVVDDEPDICDIITDVADDLGYQTLSTSNPLDFPLHYSKNLDCIVMDLSMPEMDGVELIRFLGDNRCTASIIVISGMDSSIIATAKRLAVDHGLNILGSLNKPISISDLEELLNQVPTNSPQSAPAKTRTLQEDDTDFPTAAELKAAIQMGQIIPFFQPQTQANDNSLVSVEALARWEHPKKGTLSPFHFIQFAEDNGLIDDITFSMFDQAIDVLVDWKDKGIQIGCSINFSAKSLTNLDLPDILFNMASSKGISPNYLTIEMTESAVLNEGRSYLDVLARLRMKGFKLSIDDFGTGFSSMKQLQDIPFNEVKIDRSFVMNVLNDESSKTIVETTTDLAHKLSMTIVAEGIEDQETSDFLRDLDCDLIQGYFVSPPLPKEKFETWLSDWNKTHDL